MQKILRVFLSLIFVCDAWAALYEPGWGDDMEFIKVAPIVGAGGNSSGVSVQTCFNECGDTKPCGDGAECIKNSLGCYICRTSPSVIVPVVPSCSTQCILEENENLYEKSEYNDNLYSAPEGCDITLVQYANGAWECLRSITGYKWACENGYYLRYAPVSNGYNVDCVQCPTIVGGTVASTCTNFVTTDGTVCLNTSTSMSSCYLKFGGQYTDDTGTFELAGDCYSR